MVEKKKTDPYILKDIYSEMEMELVRSFKRNLIKHGIDEYNAGFSWEMWQVALLRNMEQYRKENVNIIGKARPAVKDAIENVLKSYYNKGYNNQEESPQLNTDGGSFSFAENGKKTGDVGKTPPQENKFFGMNEKKLDALIKTMKDDFNKVDKAIYRKMDDVYRKMVAKVEFQMSTGAMSLDKAIDKATEDFLDKGINCIVYKNKDGSPLRVVNITTYAEMALRTASQRAVFLGEGSKRDKLGVHLVCVSAHANACEMCMKWQGLVLIDDVFSHPSEEYIVKYKGKYELLSKAIKEGLLHPNCRHTLFTYFEGITKIPTIIDNDVVMKNYAAEQKQRMLENKIRKAKRIVEGVVSEEEHTEAVSSLREHQKALRNHLKAHPELKRHQHREKIYDKKIKENVNSNSSSSSETRKIDSKLLDDIKQGTKLMNKEFPQFKELVNKVSYDDGATKEYAYSETGIQNGKISTTIKVGRWFSNKETLNKGIENDISKKHTYKGMSPKSLLIHEFTHALEVNITLKKLGINPLATNETQWNSFRKNYGMISNEIKTEAMENLGIEFMQPKWYKMYEDLGTYAKMNSNEFMAQCISQYLTTDKPNDIAKEVYRLLKEKMK